MRPTRWTSAACALLAGGCGAGSEQGGSPPDDSAPRAVDSQPREGDVAVAADLDHMWVRFDERMDTSVVEVALAGGDGTLALSGAFTDDARTIHWSLPALAYGTTYRLDLAAFRDAAGNALDGALYLGDGTLDFTTADATDTDPPHALSSDPIEGAVDPDPLRRTIRIVFDEAMDLSLSAVPVRMGAEPPQLVGGVWSEDDRVLTLSSDDYFDPGVAIRVDLTALRDVAGNAVDASHPYLVDGALDFALHAPQGHDCSDPLVASQADIGFGFHTWNIAPSATAGAQGAFACDGDGAGQDVVLRFEKESGTLAEGGELLHVFALAKGDSGQELALEIVSGACDGGVVHKCLSSRSPWEAFVDVPAGSYWISVADPVAGEPFPGAVVTVDEVPVAEAEGEGCFAPYDVTSANYTAPALPGDPHHWTIPAEMVSFDIAPATGTFSCQGNALAGADAVVELDKLEDDSVLYVEAETLPSPAYGPIALWVLDGCDGAYPTGTPYGCGASAFSHAFTAMPPAGRISVWVSTGWMPAEFIGAELKVTEIAVTLGETRSNPEPLGMSGPISPSSSQSLEIPSCFPAGNVHWYSYTVAGDVVGVKGDAASPLALIGPDGFEAVCSDDTSGAAIGMRLAPGSTVLVAVGSPSPITNLQIIDTIYGGMTGPGVALGVSFPPNIQDDTMDVGSDLIFIGGDDEIWSFPKIGGASAVVHGTADGLGDPQLGENMAFAEGKLYTLDDDSTSTSVSRLWAVYDEATDVWGPTAWDVPSGYPPATKLRAITHDGSDLIAASWPTTSNGGVDIFALDPDGAASPLWLGHNGVTSVRSIAADAAHFYLGTSYGIFRVDRSDIAAPAVRLSAEGVSTILVDDLGSASHLYAHDGSYIRAILGPGGAAPIDIGPIDIGNGLFADAMSIDRATGTLYVYQGTFFNSDVYAVQ